MDSQILEYLKKVKALLSEPMPDQEEALIGHLRLVEAHYSRVGGVLAEANTALDLAQGAYYDHMAGIEITQAEKKVYCDVHVAKERELRDKVLALMDGIELRINLGQSIMRQQRGERGMAR